MRLRAYHGQQAIKDATVARMAAHIKADELVRGVGFEHGRGCAVGCTLDRYDHLAYETELGIPEWVARLNDQLHEHTGDDVWPTLQLRFLRAVPVGMSFDGVALRLKSYIQGRNIERVRGLDICAALKMQVITAITDVKTLCDNTDPTAGLSTAKSAELRARSAAWSAELGAWSAESAAKSSAWASAWARAARSAESAAASAASAAASAAWSAAWTKPAESVARSAARSAASAASAARSEESAESAESAAWSAESAEYDAIAEEFIKLIEETET